MKRGATATPPSPGPMLHVHNLGFPGDMAAGRLGAALKSPPCKPPPSSPSRGGLGTPTAGRRSASPAKAATAVKDTARLHSLCQTEPTLLEPLDIPGTVSTQTDTFVRPPAPPSELLTKRGVDAATSIEPGDLFDFELEVAPVLELLVGRVLEEARIEAEGELRLAAAWQRRRRVEEARYGRLVEVQCMEGDDRRAAATWAAQEREQRERAQRAANLAVKLGVLRAAWGLVQDALAQATEELATRPSSSSSLLSFGGVAQEEVVGFLEAASTQQLRAMQASTPGALSAATSRRASSLPSTTSRPATAQAPGPRATTLLPLCRQPVASQPAEPRSATALVGELVGRVLRQAEAEAGLEAAAGVQRFRPSTALARELVGHAMQEVESRAGAELAGGFVGVELEQAGSDDTETAAEARGAGAEEAGAAAAGEPAPQLGKATTAEAGLRDLQIRPATAVADHLASAAVLKVQAEVEVSAAVEGSVSC